MSEACATNWDWPPADRRPKRNKINDLAAATVVVAVSRSPLSPRSLSLSLSVAKRTCCLASDKLFATWTVISRKVCLLLC